MWYAVLVDNPGFQNISEPVLPTVAAHNLSQQAAKQMGFDLRNSASVGGHLLGSMSFLCGYDTLHPPGEPEDCVECTRIVVEHCKGLLRTAEKHVANLGLKILEENLQENESEESDGKKHGDS